MKIKNANLTIMVRDLAKSISFYKSIGLTLSNRWGDDYAQITAPGIVIGLHSGDQGTLIGDSGNISVGFTTDDFEGIKTALEQLSITVTRREEAGGQFLHFNDPDGTALYFIQPKW